MLGFVVVILAFLALGEVVAATLLPIIPGPLVGMVLLLAAFALRRGVPTSFEAPSAALIAHLTLFILPASLGILSDWRRLEEIWLAMGAVVLAGSLATALVTAVAAGLLLRGRPSRPRGRAD